MNASDTLTAPQTLPATPDFAWSDADGDSAFMVRLTAGDADSLQDGISRAVEEAIFVATSTSRFCGVLVTRLDHDTVVVELSEDVPFGTTWESDLR
ncbi:MULTISPECIES: hypothetical protein [Arthrobacter]|uniref:Uncharacterized protein n=2 Tax=Arthrobacter TaxID=1663 RepID=A0ABU9KMM2_9MICC|nr:hypothetical protein [Arthrobacter sp. YJM1]MDP5227598.1 hypothetical protein [Arthrobacter sp. YJM1]